MILNLAYAPGYCKKDLQAEDRKSVIQGGIEPSALTFGRITGTLPPMQELEIMSPAGSFESLAAALRAGADSVYFGVGMYNMRARSTVNFTVEHMCRDYLDMEPMVVAPGVKTGIDIKYENPRELGSDRICNAVAACSAAAL